MTHIQLQNLEINLGEFHLKDINLHVKEGEYFVILGPTGAGKTILLETVAGLYRSCGGKLLLAGKDITTLQPEQRDIGFVYQDYALFPHLSVAENIAFGLRKIDLKGFARRLFSGGRKKHNIHIQRQVKKMAHMLSIKHILQRSPKTLSGGEQQRAALARALIVNPQVLLLDEPLSALDPETRENLQRELGHLHRKLGTTTLHVTHDFEEAVALADRIAIMHEGRIVQVGKPQDIFRRPASKFVAQFVGARNVFSGNVENAPQDNHKEFAINGLRFAVVTTLTGPAHASLRPEDIILSLESLHSSARNCFLATVTEIADRGTFIYVTVQVPSTPKSAEDSKNFVCMITHRSLEEMALEKGSEAYIAFKASAVHVF